MNTATLFDRSKVEKLAARYGSSLEVAVDADDVAGDSPLYEIRLNFASPIKGRADVTYLEKGGRWTVDPYFEGDSSLTADQARAVAKTLESSADLVDDLNVPGDILPWDSLKAMTIDQLAEYANSLGSSAAAVLRVAHP